MDDEISHKILAGLVLCPVIFVITAHAGYTLLPSNSATVVIASATTCFTAWWINNIDFRYVTLHPDPNYDKNMKWKYEETARDYKNYERERLARNSYQEEQDRTSFYRRY